MILNKFIWIIVLLLSAFVVSAEPYSTTWLTSGSEFNMDSINYIVYIGSGSSNTKIQLKYKDSQNFVIFNLGECYQSESRRICFDRIEHLDATNSRVEAKFYRLEPKVKFNTTINENNLFLGDEIIISSNVNIEKENVPQKLKITYILPKELEVTSRDFQIIKSTDSIKLVYETENIFPRENKFNFEIKSSELQNIIIVGEIEYIFENKKTIVYSKPIVANFLPHYNLKINFSKINESKNYNINFKIENNNSEHINFEEFTIYFPNNLEIKPPNLFKREESSVEGRFFQSFYVSTTISDEKEYDFEITPRLGNYTVLFHSKYRVKNKEYSYSDTAFNFKMESKEGEEEIKEYCTGKDFNITMNLNNSKVYFPGNEVNLILYATSVVKENITDFVFSVYWNNNLISQRRHNLIESIHRKNVAEIDLIVPYTNNLTLDILAEYYCDSNNSRFEIKDKYPIKIGNLEDIKIDKKLSETKIEGGQEIEVKVSLKSSANFTATNLKLHEIIPDGFQTRGTTSLDNFAIQKEMEVYSYILKTPTTEKDETFEIKTILSFEKDSEKFTKEKITKINVLKTAPAKLNINENYPKTNRVYEPVDIKLSFENDDEFLIEDIKIQLNNSNNYDYSIPKNTIHSLFPKQTSSASIFIIPRKVFKEPFYINISYLSKNITTHKLIKIELDLKEPIIDFPILNFELNITKFPSGLNEANIIVKNPNNINSSFTINGLGVPLNINLEGDSKYEKMFFVDRDFENKVNLEYVFLKRTYLVHPHSIIIDLVERTEKQNENEDLEKEPAIETINLEKLDEGSFLILFLIIFITLTLSFGIPTFFLIKNKKENKIWIDEKHLAEVETKHMDTVNIMSDMEKLEKEFKKEGMKQKKEEINTNKPSQIFTYDEYEKYKENLLKDSGEK